MADLIGRIYLNSITYLSPQFATTSTIHSRVDEMRHEMIM